ncbi:glycosyltransferase [Alkalihalobacterium bogoriense]|uniref:glycosyltransferase n=1 Tax=Alkalihalobacterium bogoriense TaxID=246272 RepID=UPI00047B12F4|nr:glycosyltransferase family 2 protein [Alkalihalobacterium bogoriense]
MIDVFIIVLCFFFVWVIFNSLFLPTLKEENIAQPHPRVSLLIPLRNEERNIKGLLDSIDKLTYSNVEIILLDDHSTDKTVALIEEKRKTIKQIQLIKGEPLPPGWIGKSYACHQLSKKATGEYYFFIDADVRLHQRAIERCVSTMEQRKCRLITGFPHFPTSSFLSQLLVPMQHFIVFFHLPLMIANQTKVPLFSAAHGAFMFFHSKSYEDIGGHVQVKQQIVEDVQLTRNMKENQFSVLLANVTTTASCYMYETNREVWEGFLKNIFNGIGRSFLLGAFIIVVYFLFFVSPLFLASFGVLTSSYIFLVPLCIVVLIRAYVDLKTKQTFWLSFLMPFSSLFLIILLLHAMIAYVTHKGFTWKGRHYS